jgi:hypothetical protein
MAMFPGNISSRLADSEVLLLTILPSYQPDQAASVAQRFFRFRFPCETRADPPETKRILGLGSLRLLSFLMFENHFTKGNITPLYCVWNADGDALYIRAKSREEAKATIREAYPDIQFYR